MAVVRVYTKLFCTKLVDVLTARVDDFEHSIHFCLVNSMCVYCMRHCAIVNEFYSYDISLCCPQRWPWNSSIKRPYVITDPWRDFHCLPIVCNQCELSYSGAIRGC